MTVTFLFRKPRVTLDLSPNIQRMEHWEITGASARCTVDVGRGEMAQFETVCPAGWSVQQLSEAHADSIRWMIREHYPDL